MNEQRYTHARKTILLATAVVVAVCFASALWATPQDNTASTTLPASGTGVPRLVSFGGVLKDSAGKPITGAITLTFSLYAFQEGGSPLWIESQKLQLDDQGHYTVLLGATEPNGLPLDLFTSGQAQWLGVQPQMAGFGELPRVLLVGMPYALKAADADTLGGMPASAFVQAAAPAATADAARGSSNLLLSGGPAPGQASTSPANLGGTGTTDFIPIWTNSTTLGNSTIFETGGNVGIGTTTPKATLDINGGADLRGNLVMISNGNATPAKGANSHPFDLFAQSWNSGTNAGVNQHFRWQAEPVGNNTASPSGKLNLLFASGSGIPSETGLSISAGGVFSFAAGQKFPGAGTITGVTAGTDVSGGGTSGNVTLNLNTAALQSQNDARYARLAAANSFTGKQSVTGNISATGSVSAASFSGSGSGLSGVNAQTFASLPLADFALQIQSNTFPADQFFNGNGLTMLVGDPGCGAGFAAIGFGALSGCNNYSLLGDSTNTYINRPTGGQILFREGNGDEMIIRSGGNVLISVPDSGFLNSALEADANDSSSQNIALKGFASGIDGIAIYGEDDNGIASTGVQGVSNSGFALFASGSAAVTGNLTVDGSISAGTKDFKIDHPLDPANQYLYHASVESSEMMNIYTGNVTTDSQGDAVVALPAWFEAVNGDFRYQLTVVGQFAQAIVGSEIANHQFSIKTDKPNVKVSWLVTGVRHDAFARLHPLVVEQAKPARERGYYLHPDAFGQPPERQTMWGVMPQRMKYIKEQQAKAKARLAQAKP